MRKIQIYCDAITYFLPLCHYYFDGMNKLKEILRKQGRSNKWLAVQLGKSENTIGSWCANKTQPKLNDIEKICKILTIKSTDIISI
jgi:DNA-binding Xre family transcriptional regulator